MLFQDLLNEGKMCTVEMKSGLYFKGKLAGLDNYMNIMLSHLVFADHEDYQYLRGLDLVFLRGDKIKFVTYDN